MPNKDRAQRFDQKKKKNQAHGNARTSVVSLEEKRPYKKSYGRLLIQLVHDSKRFSMTAITIYKVIK